MGSYSDSTSDLDEELPVFDFLQPGRHVDQASQRRDNSEKPDLFTLDDSDAEQAAISSPGKGRAGVRPGAADVLMISSDSDEDAPYIPLAERLKQRRDNVITASSAVANGKDTEQYLPSNLANSQLSRQNGISQSDRPLGSRDVRTVSRGASGVPEEPEELPRLPQKPFSSTGSADSSPAKRKPAKRTVEEIQASREEALRRRQAKERHQQDKEALRQEQERQKAERKLLAEAAKALKPEECIKHMVAAVDPGKNKTLNNTCQCVVILIFVFCFEGLI